MRKKNSFIKDSFKKNKPLGGKDNIKTEGVYVTSKWGNKQVVIAKKMNCGRATEDKGVIVLGSDKSCYFLLPKDMVELV